MTQDELWLRKYKEVHSFIETHLRNPSRYDPEERGKYCNWITLMKYLKAIWMFCSYLFVPQRRSKELEESIIQD